MRPSRSSFACSTSKQPSPKGKATCFTSRRYSTLIARLPKSHLYLIPNLNKLCGKSSTIFHFGILFTVILIFTSRNFSLENGVNSLNEADILPYFEEVISAEDITFVNCPTLSPQFIANGLKRNRIRLQVVLLFIFFFYFR